MEFRNLKTLRKGGCLHTVIATCAVGSTTVVPPGASGTGGITVSAPLEHRDQRISKWAYELGRD
eukprot:2643519-Rhodomonas_salina.2